MSNTTYLMLDEPSLGLAAIVVTALFTVLTRVRELGVALVLVEQNVSISLPLAYRRYLMEAGRFIGSDTAKALLASAALPQAFLGGTAA